MIAVGVVIISFCCHSSAVATVINRLNLPEVTVSVDGSLYRFHPHFHDLMKKKISQLIKPQHKVQIKIILMVFSKFTVNMFVALTKLQSIILNFLIKLTVKGERQF